MSRTTLTTALACLTLAGCSSTPPAAVTAPASLTQPCAPLTPLAKDADFGKLLEAAVEAAGKYREVCTQKDALSRLVAP